MRETVHIEPEYRHLFAFVDEKRPFESISEHFGFKLGKDQRRRAKVVRGELEGPDGGKVAVYFKLYGYRRLRRALSRVFKPTRSKSEFANLKLLHSLGIPACVPVVQGEYRNALGIARNCMIITREVSGSMQLDQFIDALEAGEEDASLKRDLRRQIIESVAANLRKIHGHGFYHDDLKWRNILVRRAGERGERVEVFWIDCPNGYSDHTGGFRGRHGRIKDLATMDHPACGRCPIRERLLFLSVYTGLAPGDPKLRELATRVVDYRRASWPTEGGAHLSCDSAGLEDH